MLTRANLTIGKFALKASKVGSVLEGVAITPEYTAVSDGHRLVKVGVTKGDETQWPNFPGFVATREFERFVMRAEDAAAIAQAIPSADLLWPVRHAAVNASCNGELATNDLTTKHLFKIEHLEGSYPDVDRVIPARDEADFTTQVNAKWLAGLLQEVAANNPKMPFVELRFYTIKEGEDGRAIRLDATTAEDQEWVGVLMPMRMDTREEKAGK